ncbi:hypothetical protein [Tabrizicola sp.]|uniref:hypothetical protein n=1 Tax=Tabrizicola sp. TaxID=2005166 RepID=UPI0027374B58|nr:hypothetical protein [Tabrizicola sp.]MDP3194619.1 hypothetical protein [Tabrizicola sp.]
MRHDRIAGFGVGFAFCLAAGVVPIAAQDGVTRPIGIATSVASSFHSWDGDAGSSGSQWFSTASVGIARAFQNGAALDLALRTGYVTSSSTTESGSGTVGALIDTTLHAKLSLLDDPRYQPFLTFDVNLPTGKATLYGDQQYAIMDRDLVPQDRLGEGFNANPGVGVTIPLSDKWIASGGLGYNLRGSYVPNGDTSRTFDPGNQLIASAGLTFTDDRTLFSLTSIHSTEGASTLDDEDYFRPGASTVVSLQFARSWAARHQTRLSFSVNSTKRNEFSDFFAGGFTEESQNSNSTVYQGSVGHVISLSDSLTLNGELGYLHRTRNDYAPESDFYTPAKEKISFGLGAAYRISDEISAVAGFEAFRLQQDATPYLGANTYTGANVHASIDIGF